MYVCRPFDICNMSDWLEGNLIESVRAESETTWPWENRIKDLAQPETNSLSGSF